MLELVREILSPAGPIAQTLGRDFEPRPEQLDMAQAAARAMEGRSHLLVEAGTGVGKSLAYLVPAAIRCLLHSETVIISTYTISLQEQLIHKDIPLIQAAVEPFLARRGLLHPDATLRPVLAKGRGNYLSIRRLALASARQDRLFPDPAARRSLHTIEDWALHTRDGTLATLPILERPGVWDRVQSDSGNCMGRRCPTYEQCFYQKARRDADQANLLVCNHALFFSDLAMRTRHAGFLPERHHVILDEAHRVEEVAADQFGLSLSETRILHLLSTLYHPRRRKGYLASLALMSGDSAAVDATIRIVLEAHSAAESFFDSIQERLRGRPTLRVREPGLVVNVLSPVLLRLSLRLADLKDRVLDEADRFELNAFHGRAADLAAACAEWVEQRQEGQAYWIEQGAEAAGSLHRPRRRITLASAPVDVAPVLREHLFGNRNWSITLTSATLATGPADSPDPFAFTLRRLGCDGAETLALGSSFDYASQVEFHVDLRAPEPPEQDRARKTTLADDPDALSRLVIEHVRATDGGAFVLFTSLKSLQDVADRVQPELERLGMPLFVQNRTGPRTRILEAFRQSDRGVLLGAFSFWEGVDVRGDALRNVIIVRLPFEAPDEPLAQARAELIQARGGSPFLEDALPRAVLRFKQGFGRLIRSRTDRGRVVVLDHRIVRRGYGRAFIRALPPGLRLQLHHPDHIEEVEVEP